MSGLVVKKFGGTSVGSIDRIRSVAKLVASHVEKTGDQVVVVASAMSGETNKLVKLAEECVAKPEPRELDVLLATGEQVTISLLAMALIELGLPAKSLLAPQVRITTDSRFSNAQIENVDHRIVKDTLKKGIIPVVAGFQGIDSDGNLTTLGRGGSDITGVAIAAALKATKCYIYTDVEGVFSSDPRICQKAKAIPFLCHEEMLELASLGAKVLHPRSVYFAWRYNVPLVVLSTFNPGMGTSIVKESELMEEAVVSGITYRTDEAKVTIPNLPSSSGVISELFKKLAGEGFFIDMITQTGYFENRTNLSFTVPEGSAEAVLEVCKEFAFGVEASEPELDVEIAKVSVVGIGMRYHTGVAADMFASLADEQIDVQMISTSEIKISVIIPRKYCEVAVRCLHEKFIEHELVVGVEES